MSNPTFPTEPNPDVTGSFPAAADSEARPAVDPVVTSAFGNDTSAATAAFGNDTSAVPASESPAATADETSAVPAAEAPAAPTVAIPAQAQPTDQSTYAAAPATPGYAPGYAAPTYPPAGYETAPTSSVPAAYAPQGYAQPGYVQQPYAPVSAVPQGYAQPGYAPAGAYPTAAYPNAAAFPGAAPAPKKGRAATIVFAVLAVLFLISAIGSSALYVSKNNDLTTANNAKVASDKANAAALADLQAKLQAQIAAVTTLTEQNQSLTGTLKDSKACVSEAEVLINLPQSASDATFNADYDKFVKLCDTASADG